MFPIKKVVLVTGANGQLGQEFRLLSLSQEKYEFLFTTRETLDISNAADVIHVFKKFRPDYCINCAAYTNVDKAESEEEKAFLLNSKSVEHLVNACQIYGCQLIHFSSDYVYNSISNRPILESDECQPKGVYAKSKRAGELVLENSQIIWLCIRVSWLYSSFNHNFVKTMLKLGLQKESINVVSDQMGSPTYARDLAKDVLYIISTEQSEKYKGHYNYSNTGVTSWADFARTIFKRSDISCLVNNISTTDFGAPAPRPAWSVMSKEKIKNTFGLTLSEWKKSLSACLLQLEKYKNPPL